MFIKRRPKNIFQLNLYVSDKNSHYSLRNYKNKTIFRADRGKLYDGGCEAVFENCKTGKKELHRVGQVAESKLGRKTFTFDGHDIHRYLNAKGITFRITVVSDSRIVFRIFEDGEYTGSARIEKAGSKVRCYTQCDIEDIRLLFLTLFTLVRISLT